MPHFLFLIASARKNGNSELLARLAAKNLGSNVQQTWLHLQDLPLPAFVDIRHDVGVYPEPTGNAKTLCDATLAATDIVVVAPLYWYSLPTNLKRYLDEWSAWMRVTNLNFKPSMKNKTMWAIACSAGDAADAEPMFESLRLSANYMQMRWGGSVLGNGSQAGDVLNDTDAIGKTQKLFV